MENLLTLLESNQLGGQIIAQNSQQSLSATNLISRCYRLAKVLIQREIKVLALHGDNSIEWLIVDLACQQASICLVPLPTFFSSEQLQYILNSAPIDAILTEKKELLNELSCSDNSKSEETILQRYHLLRLNHNKISNALPKHTHKITFTSGSTGKPKGVCLSTSQMLKHAKVLAETISLKKQRHLCLLPLSTLLENIAGLYLPLSSGGEVIIPSLAEIGFSGSSTLNTEKFCQSISKYEPNSIILTPQLLIALIAAIDTGWSPPLSLQFIAVGGSKLSRQVLSRTQELNLPVYEGYGLSECTSVVSLNTVKNNKISSCGKPLPHLNVEIDNGEIIVSGNIMLGYLNEPDSWNKEKIHSGDLGAIDDEGFLTINGRKNNLLISSFGRNVNPEWVESELLSHTSILECVALGDAKPYLIALLTPRDTNSTNESLQRVINACNNRLPDYAQIKKWHRLSQPLHKQHNLITDNGRPIRHAIRARYKDCIESLYSTN
ncbi:MAG: long-chain fatty acid--CoA ligase [Gammaproteobacteria bacterium]|nr:AMP-binding protein [Gammaproteobacteria bacterium]PCH62169.1 MAG: long-chain fatty acid--CoA ligase [Gammaproteobacteria bacterium]